LFRSAHTCGPYGDNLHDEEFIMNTQPQNDGNNGLLIGLIAGGVIGAGLAIAFAPRIAELRRRVMVSATDLSQSASQRYQDVSTRVAGVVDEVTARGQTVRDDVADAVSRGARQVEQIAMASKSGRPTRQS
jgi:gas vesicle protein